LVTLVFSLAASTLIVTVVKKEGPEPLRPNSTLRHLFRNYRVLNEFLNLPVRDEFESESMNNIYDEEMGPGIDNPLIADLLKLEKAKTLLEEKKYPQMGAILSSLESQHPFIDYKKSTLQLKFLYFRQNYNEFIRLYPRAAPARLDLKLLLINSYLKTGMKDSAFILFRKLFAENRLEPFQTYLSSMDLGRFLSRLDYGFWYNKFKFLAGGNLFTEFTREKRYVRAPQLINLFYAEFYYRQKRYDLCKRYLARVTDDKLQRYKMRMVLKMQLRDDQYGNLFDMLDTVRGEADLYFELLLDCASILLNKGEADLSLKVFSRYVTDFKVFHAALTTLFKVEGLLIRDSEYWKVLWVSAWLHFRKNDKKTAAAYFKEGSTAPIKSYKIASSYWLRKLNKKEAADLGIDMDHYPFTYYYTRENPRLPPPDGSLDKFIQLLAHPRGPRFDAVISRLKPLVKNNLMDDASDYIQWAVRNETLSGGDKHTLLLIQSILYLRQGNDAMAFISFRDNFDCYRCVRLPRFLRRIVLPVKYGTLVEYYCDEYELDVPLVYALIREESYFRSNAVSSANAYGLMQLLLKTARQVALTHDRKVYRRDLFVPETNIRYGTEYLRLLLDKYNNKLHLALAAYNAGDHRVDDWLQRFGDVPDDQFIEMIPFSATRSYVKNILRNYYYYRFYYGETNE
jgi:soluble lytic murein transglycosylase